MTVFNLPPGVRDDEYEIAGAECEAGALAYCPICSLEREGWLESTHHQRWFVCGTCGEATDLPEAILDSRR